MRNGIEEDRLGEKGKENEGEMETDIQPELGLPTFFTSRHLCISVTIPFYIASAASKLAIRNERPSK
jgi:hypothetical protein